MQKCPNCGQPAMRTEDWACQWCGYPLLSNAYRKIDKTYKEIKEERQIPSNVEVETQPSPVAADTEHQLQASAPEPASQANAEAASVAEPAAKAPQPASEAVKEESPAPLVEEIPEEAQAKASDTSSEAAATETSEVLITPPPQETPEAMPEAIPEKAPEPEGKPQVEPEQEAPVAELETEPDNAGEDRLAPEAEPEWEPVAVESPAAKAEAADLTPISGEISVTVSGLGAAFVADRAAASENLKGKVISVTGSVDKVVVKEHLDIRYVLLSGDDISIPWNVRCTFGSGDGDVIGRLDKGQSVTIQGAYKGLERNILLRECAIIG
ncbi:hypothetical protein ACFLYV_01630 [Chloroflexota bacterium]